MKSKKSLLIPKFTSVNALIAGSVLVNIVSWVLILWRIPFTEETVFLHYNIFFGIDLTGSWWQLLWVPGTGSLILILNTVAVYVWKKMESIMSILVLAVTLFLESMVLLSSILLVLLNAS